MKFNLETIKRKLLVKYPFFGNVIANSKYKKEERILTAATDGITIYYNPKFFEKFNIEEQTFILAHEVCHIAFNHILRSEGKIKELWNIATDAVINANLKRDGLKVIEGSVEIENAIKYDAETLYEKLLKEQENNQNNQDGNSGNQSGEKGGEQNGNGKSEQTGETEEQNKTTGNKESQDDEENKENDGNSSSSNNSEELDEDNKNTSGNSKEGQAKTQDDSHSLWDEAVKKNKEEQEKKEDKINEKNAFEDNLKEKKKELEKLKEELINASKEAGTSTNGDVINVGKTGHAKKIIDWRYVLREAIKYDIDWSTRNCYIEDGVVCSTLEEFPTPETEILLDTSGSISEDLLRNFLRECKNILQHSKVKVGCFDTQFYGFKELRTEEDIEKMEFRGGGGTDFDVAVNSFTRRVENKIIFTDGYANMPQKNIDAIWVVFGEDKINPKGGKVIYVNEDMLDRLRRGRQYVKVKKR